MHTSGGNGYATCYLKDGTNETTTGGPSDSDAQLTLNTWHHITCIRNVSTDTLSIYLDGVLVDSDTDNTTADATTNDDTTIGARSGSKAESFNGSIDQVQIYDYVRSPAQIAWDYNRGKPVGHWKLDECSGTVANDSGSGENNGTITPGGLVHTSAGTCNSGSPTEMWDDGQTGKRNFSLDFDGSDDYVDMNDVAEFDFNDQDFSIAGWFNRETFNTDDTIVAKKNDQTNGTAGFIVWIDGSTDDLRLFVSDGDSTNDHTVDSTTTFTATGWSHFVIVYDDSASTASKIYINGSDDSSGNTTTGTFSSINDLSNALDFRIGSESFGGRVFAGELDDIRIYNYTLTADQVKRVYNNGAVFFGPNEGSP
jgi:hypothetical protein